MIDLEIEPVLAETPTSIRANQERTCKGECGTKVGPLKRWCFACTPWHEEDND